MQTRLPITLSRSLAGALASALVLGACAGSQSADRLSARVENLEARDARLAATDQRLERVEARSEELARQMASMSERLAGIEARLETLATQQPRTAPPPRPSGPDPAVVYAVPVGDSPVEGPASAKITIVEAFEFACPFCERSRATMDAVRRHYGEDVRIVYKHYIVHPSAATIPAQAACAAHLQGKFTEMKDAIWEKGFKANRNLGEDNMLRQARRIKLDMRRFQADMRGPCVARVQQDHEAMAKVGVRGTPGFFVNGRFVAGAQPFAAFQALIDEELARANEIIRTQGVQPRDYYETQVVARGRASIFQ